jgi:hypothetical protein
MNPRESDATMERNSPGGGTPGMLPAIARPDGRIYQPRKVVAHAVIDGDELLEGVVVFGTHDPDRALPLASEYVAWQIDSGYAPADPEPVWWRDGYASGHRTWMRDEKTGRAGVWFRKIVEAQGEPA